MPTIIDSLVVTLGLDSSNMDAKAPTSTKKLKDLQNQGKKTGDEVTKLGKSADDTSSKFESVSKAVAGFLALIGGTMAIRSFINDQVAANAELERMAKNLGINVSTLSAWGNAVEEVGGSASGLQGTMDMLSKSQTELRLTGQSSLIPYFSALGVSLSKVGGGARDVTGILADMASYAEGKDRTTMHNMFSNMGIDEGTINLMLQGRKELELTLKRQKEYNAVTKAQAEQAVKLQRTIVDVKQTFNALGRELLEQATPALEWLVGVMQRVGDWAQKNSQFIGDFAKVLGAVAVAVAAIGLATSPLALATAGIVALAAGVALLWQDYQTWKRGGESFIDWGKWEPGITAATAGIHALTGAIDGLRSSYRAIKAVGGIFKTLLPGDPNGDPSVVASELKGAWHEYVAGGGPTIIDRFDASMANAPHTRSRGATAKAAMAEAQRVSAKIHVPADIIYAHWAHETNNFKNRGAEQLNNLAGINIPGGKGEDYRTFASLDAFGDYYAYLMRPGGRYGGVVNARTPEEYAAILKAGGYYSDKESNYAAGMRHFMPSEKGSFAQSLMGIPGATGSLKAAPQAGVSGSSSTVNSTSVTTGPINVYTQATDADGIAKDMRRSMDYLFTSNANPGLF